MEKTETMSLNEAITHCKENAQKEFRDGNFHCASEHEQLAIWLSELQECKAGVEELEAQLTWRPASDLPEEGQIVIATYLNSYGKRRRVSAVYIRQYEVEAGEDDELCVEYCEEKDEWYLKEGWYELVDNWGDYSLVAIVEGTVDHWLPMPKYAGK